MGYANVDRMLDEMDATHLTEWMAFYGWEAKAQEDAQRRADMEARAKRNTPGKR